MGGRAACSAGLRQHRQSGHRIHACPLDYLVIGRIRCDTAAEPADRVGHCGFHHRRCAQQRVFPHVTQGRWRIAFAFGLLHGFGFASVLAEMGLPKGARLASLVAFNLGVEAGQLAVVLAVMPLKPTCCDPPHFIGAASCRGVPRPSPAWRSSGSCSVPCCDIFSRCESLPTMSTASTRGCPICCAGFQNVRPMWCACRS